jgi:hypothetical protein
MTQTTEVREDKGWNTLMQLIFILAAMALLAAAGSADAPGTDRLEQSPRLSTRLGQDGLVIKQVVFPEVTIAASIRDRGDAFSVEVEISNDGQSELDLRPDDVIIEVTRPGLRRLAPVPPGVVADNVLRRARSEAAGVEGRGFGATTVIHEQVPVVETSFNPASIGDPSQPTTVTTMKSETVVRVVPDEAARLQAWGEAAAIRSSAEVQARKIVASALVRGPVAGNSKVSGFVYFERQADVQEVVLRVPLGALTPEISFTAAKKRPFPWKQILLFE